MMMLVRVFFDQIDWRSFGSERINDESTYGFVAGCGAGEPCGGAAGGTTLTFEGLKNYEEVENYYNGGKGSKGSGPGTNYGVTFSSNALAWDRAPIQGQFRAPGEGQLYVDGSVSFKANHVRPFSSLSCSKAWVRFPRKCLIRVLIAPEENVDAFSPGFPLGDSNSRGRAPDYAEARPFSQRAPIAPADLFAQRMRS